MKNMADEWEEDGLCCPVCGQGELIPITGPKSAPILLVAYEASSAEAEDGLPFVGPAGGVLRTELAFADIDLRSCRRMLVWQHPPAKGKGNKNNECLKHFIEVVIQEAKYRSLVVLVGAEAVRLFTGEDISAVSGLPLQSKYFSAPTFPMIAPGNVFRGGVGELRFALRELSALVKRMSLDTPAQKRPKQEILEEVEDW